MLQLLPFLSWLAAITSAVLLVALWTMEELPTTSAAILLVWFLLAAWSQFFATADLIAAIGLLLQTVLAISLFLRWKLAG